MKNTVAAYIKETGLGKYIAKKHIEKIETIEIESDGRVYITLKRGFNNGNDGIAIYAVRSQLRKEMSYIEEGEALEHRRISRLELEEKYAEISEDEKVNELVISAMLGEELEDEEIEMILDNVEIYDTREVEDADLIIKYEGEVYSFLFDSAESVQSDIEYYESIGDYKSLAELTLDITESNNTFVRFRVDNYEIEVSEYDTVILHDSGLDFSNEQAKLDEFADKIELARKAL